MSAKTNVKKLLAALLLYVLAALPCTAQYKLDTIRYAGNSDDYTDIVYLCEGFTSSELDKFVKEAKSHDSYFFKKEPWKRYSKLFNVFYVKTSSNVSGAGMTPDAPIDNFYGTTFGCAGVDRMPWPTNMSKVYEVLNKTMPKYDLVIILVNSSKYGGAGNSSLKMMCLSLDGSSKETVCHEAGHAFAGLADEYWYDRTEECPNDARSINPVKWQSWVGINNVGVYPFEDTKGWYRPHENCLMRYLNSDYCAVCRETIIEAIHKKSKFIKSYSPQKGQTEIYGDTTFALQILAPSPNTLRREWVLDDKRVAYNVDKYQLEADKISEGDHVLSVTVNDTTLMVKKTTHSILHTTTITWKIHNNVSSGIRVLESDEDEFSVGPIPFTDELTFTNKKVSDEKVRMELYNLQGASVAQGVFPGNAPATLSTAGIAPGIYILQVLKGDRLIYSRKVTKEN